MGMPLESDLPYKGRDATCAPYTAAVKSTGYVKLPVNDKDALETAIATKGPVSVTVAANWGMYGGGIFNGGCKSSSCALDHGVVAVGYDSSDGYWLVRNSWGSGWGEDGYIRLTRANDGVTYTDTRPADGVACKPYPSSQTVGGESGILFDTSYPTGLSSADIDTTPPHSAEWTKFQQKFGKTYNGVDEEAKRFEIFQKNMDFIQSQNAKGLSYTLGWNQFTDLTGEEFAAQNMGYRKPTDLYLGAPFLGNHTWDGDELPSSIDWVAKGAVTPVKNQGQCGSCWAFSTTGSIEGANQIANGQLVSLSEQQFVDCPHGIQTLGCNGGSMSAGFGYAKKAALCTEASYPYEAKNGACRTNGCTVGLAKGKVTGYKGLAPISRIVPASENTMMSAVAQQPVSIAIEADKDIFQHYKSGVLTGSCGSALDHGVLAVGYGTDSSGGDYWKVKNSWGTSYGESGFVRLARGKGTGGECGLLLSPSYPVVSTSSTIIL